METHQQISSRGCPEKWVRCSFLLSIRAPQIPFFTSTYSKSHLMVLEMFPFSDSWLGLRSTVRFQKVQLCWVDQKKYSPGRRSELKRILHQEIPPVFPLFIYRNVYLWIIIYYLFVKAIAFITIYTRRRLFLARLWL